MCVVEQFGVTEVSENVLSGNDGFEYGDGHHQSNDQSSDRRKSIMIVGVKQR